MKTVFLKKMTLTAAAVLMAACSSTPPPPNSSTVANNIASKANIATLKLAGGTDWGYPTPFLLSRGPGLVHSLYIFDTLTWKDKNGKHIPWLAESWAASPDGLTWTFKLHPKAKWHDGKPVTADDVKFSVDYQTKNVPALPVRALTELTSVTVKGEKEVEFKLKSPYAPFLTNLAGALLILPKHIWEGVEDPKKMRDAKALTGSGPYKLKEYNQTDGSYWYEANKDFYLGEPVVKQLQFIPVKDEFLALQQGQLDAGSIDSFGAAADSATAVQSALSKFKSTPWALLEAPGEWTMALKYNMTKAPFNDIRFRKALAYAINMQDMVDRVVLGQGVPGSQGWATMANVWYNPNITIYKQDLVKANALLDEMGLKDSDKDGLRELAGKPLEIELLFAAGFDTPRVPELVQQYLKEVGIKIKVVGIDRNQRDTRATKGEYDLILVGFGGLGGDPDGLRTTFSSKLPRNSFSQPFGWKNDEFDQLADQQFRIVDENERRKITDKLQQMLSDELPQLHLYHPTRFWAYRKDILDGWHYTLGGIASGVPQSFDKALFVTGK